jgi:hypothetical protein
MGRLPPLLKNQPRWIQITLAVVVPVLYGALTGYVLGTSETGYLILGLLAAFGGVAAGFDHDGAGAGAKRGILGGLLFGSAILIAHEIDGSEAKANLPDPAVLLLLFTIIPGIALGALGGRLRGRVEAAQRATTP